MSEQVVPPPTYVSQPDTTQPQPQAEPAGNISPPPPAATTPAGMSGQPQHYFPPPQVVPSAAQVRAEYQHQLLALCAQGNHDPTTKYGVCGIIFAIICFPIGLICLFLDTETRCARCGVMLHG